MSLAALFAESGTTSAYNGTLRQFVRETNPKYRWYRHVEMLAESLEAIVAGDLSRLMVFMPPRHGKSELVSRLFPAYVLAKHPDRWVGLCSYEATLAQDFSRTARDAYTRVGAPLRDDSRAVSLWQTPARGGMWAAGVGGPITGKGFHVGIIDDPIKNEEEAQSETIRAKHKSWYQSTFHTREEPGGSEIVVQTRWHEDDLAGWLLAQEAHEPQGWTVINFEAIAERPRQSFPVTCPIAEDWREEGDALCPERYTAVQLDTIRRTVGSRVWEALYQQRPSAAAGTIFKRDWWQFYTALPPLGRTIQSWDMAFKDEASSDFVAGHVWAREGSRFYLLDRVKERLSFTASCQAVRSMTAKHPTARGKYIEDKANGPAVINALRREIAGIVGVKPDGGKVARAYAVQPLVEAGQVYLPDPTIAPWVEDFIRELASFPNGAHDDDVDACTQALNVLAWGAHDPIEEPAERSAFDPDVLREEAETKAKPLLYRKRQRSIRPVDSQFGEF